MRTLDERSVEAAVLGGSILASGGTDDADAGRALGSLAVAYGTPRLASLDELPEDGLIVTVSQVGAQSADEPFVEPRDFVRSFQLIADQMRAPIVAVMAAQNGASATVQPWLHASVVPHLLVADVAADGRAHPTARMGAMGLTQENGSILQAAAGGDQGTGRYVEMLARGTVDHTSTLVRHAAIEAGGVVANARMPLSVAYLRDHAAMGAITFAIELGMVVIEAQSGGADAIVQALGERVGAHEIGHGRVREIKLEARHGFEVGKLLVGERTNFLEIAICNEYMAAELRTARLASFPDVICTLAEESGLPIGVADLKEQDAVRVIAIPARRVPLGASLSDPSVYPDVERLLNMSLSEYALKALSPEPPPVTAPVTVENGSRP